MTARTAAAAALALLAMTAGSACGTGASSGPASGLPAGPTFLSPPATANGPPKHLVAGTRIQLSFRDGLVTANAGCNTMSGRASLHNGGLVIDGDTLAMTAMGCLTAGLGEQDVWLSTFITSGPAL